MRNSIIIIGIVFFIFFSCTAQDKKTFTLKANWKKGEVKEMLVQQSSSWKTNEWEDISPTETTAKYSITIIDKTNKGYLVEWKALIADIELEEVDFMKDYVSQFKYLIETDSNGKFKELSNWESLVELNKELKERVIKEAEKENISRPVLDHIIAKMELPETKDELMDMCKGLTEIYLGSYGVELPLNDTTLEPTTIPNQHLKEGIPVTLKTVIKELDHDKISMTYSYVYDEEKIKELSKKHFPDQEYTGQKTSSYTEYIYNRKTGWIEKITIHSEFDDGRSMSTAIIEYIIK